MEAEREASCTDTAGSPRVRSTLTHHRTDSPVERSLQERRQCIQNTDKVGVPFSKKKELRVYVSQFVPALYQNIRCSLLTPLIYPV